MSVRKIATIHCDGEDEEGRPCLSWVGLEQRTAEARQMARECGWQRRDGLDLCPECVGQVAPTPTPTDQTKERHQ